MDRREFLAVAAAPLLLRALPDGCALAVRHAARARVLVTADTEAHVVVLDATGRGRVTQRLATREGPRSIEALGGGRALVAHTDEGCISLLEDRPLRVRRVLRGLSQPRYTAAAPDGRHAYVTDSGLGAILVIDLERGRVAASVDVNGPARHLSLAPNGRALWVALGTRASRIVVVDVSDPRRPRAGRIIEPPFSGHDIAWEPDGRSVWVTSGEQRRIAVYGRNASAPARILAADAAPQHVAFSRNRAYVASGDDGRLATHRLADGAVLARASVPRGSFNVTQAAGVVVTPSLEAGTLAVLATDGRVLRRRQVAVAAHDAALVI